MSRSTPLVPKYPPLHLYALLRPRDRSAWMTIHRHQSRSAWRRARRKGLGPTLRLLAHVAVWPFFVLGHTATQGRYFARSVRRATGKGVGAQLAEMLWLGWAYWIAPKAYYLYGLHRQEARAVALRYVHRYEAKVHRGYQFVGESRVEYEPRLGNKEILHERCLAEGIPVAPILLKLSRGRVVKGALEERRLPPQDLFCKPAIGKGGRGIELWRLLESGDYLGSAGARLDSEGLLDHLLALSHEHPILVQPRLRNHEELGSLAGPALSTIRIVTIKNEQRAIEATAAVFKIAPDGAIADNGHLGSLAAAVNLETGVLGPATGLDPSSGRHARHPTRGDPIAGAKLPLWAEALALAVRAHECFPQRTVFGWDVALTDRGAQLIEANVKPGFNLHQIAEDRPLGDSRLGELLAFHIRNGEPASPLPPR